MGNTLTINIALTPTLHNDMLIIKQGLHLPSFAVHFNRFLCFADIASKTVEFDHLENNFDLPADY